MSRLMIPALALLLAAGACRGDEPKPKTADRLPFMVHRWRQPLTIESQVMSWLYDGPASAVRRMEDRGQAVLPAAVPLAVTLKRPKDGQLIAAVVFRTHRGVAAADLKGGRLLWRAESAWSLEKMQADTYKSPALHQWIGFWKDQNRRPDFLLENSTLGSLSTDGIRLYAIEDLAVPPVVHPKYDPRFGGRNAADNSSYNAVVNDAMLHNELQAHELATGKLKWSLGGKTPAVKEVSKDPKDLLDSYFLGPPLPLDGRLYFVNEKDRQIRLVCLDPRRIVSDIDKEKIDAVLWVQTLGTAKETMLEDPTRRTTAAQIAYAEGVLVCPTNAGQLVGVDLLTHRVLWTHAYREPLVVFRWKSPGPVIADGRVVFTAPDGNSLYCLNLRTGARVWTAREEDDLYLAGASAGRAVVVGKKSVRALALDDGDEVWRVDTGLPSGRGGAADNVYYLPLKEFRFPDREVAPAVLAIDAATGKIVARARSRFDREMGMPSVPGNLIFFDDVVVSQNAAEVVAYPQLAAKLRNMDELLKKNPKDPMGLFERGELRLEQGDRLGAVQDLLAALANGAPPEAATRAAAKLHQALTELLQYDFKSGKKFLKDYEALCRVEVDPKADPEKQKEQKAEGLRRRSTYFALAARGLRSEGNLTEALNAYLDYAALGAGAKELFPIADDSDVRARADVWARGRIAALFAAAKPEQRAALDKIVAARYAEGRDADLDKLRTFVALFASTPLGSEARLRLAERLAEQDAKGNLLEAERHLLLLERQAADRATAGRAADTLARLLMRPEMYEDAAHYYRLLRDRYGDVVVRDGKSGAELFKDAHADKRLLPYLEAAPRRWPKQVRAKDETGSFPQGPRHLAFALEPVGEVPPSLRRQRVALEYGTANRVVFGDRDTGAVTWAATPNVAHLAGFIPYMAKANDSAEGVRFGYRGVGHLLVLDLGTAVLAVDPVRRKILWEKSLFSESGPPAGGNLTLDPDDGSLRRNFADGYFLTLGRNGPVSATCVCVQTRQGLTALDPLTGATLWERADVPSRCRLFGDEEFVYLVETDAGGAPVKTRAFRCSDGAAVVVPDFAAAYKSRQRVMGRTILVSESGPKGLALRLYDIPTGKDLWAKTYPAGSILLRSQEFDLAGAISPDGRASVVSLAARKEVVVSVLDPKDLQNVKEAHLLADGELVLIALHVVNPQGRQSGADIRSNLHAGVGLRGLTVNGKVYAFHRRTSKIAWVYDVQDQQLVLEQWKEMPVLLFTGRYVKMQDLGGGRWMYDGSQLVAVQGILKASGKLAFHRENMGQQTQPFYAINNDARGGKIEMIAPNYKVTFTVEKE